MAARKSKIVEEGPRHVKQVMRAIRRLTRPFPLSTAQARLDEIADLATGKVSTSPVPIRSNREEPPSASSSEAGAE